MLAFDWKPGFILNFRFWEAGNIVSFGLLMLDYCGFWTGLSSWIYHLSILLRLRRWLPLVMPYNLFLAIHGKGRKLLAEFTEFSGTSTLT